MLTAGTARQICGHLNVALLCAVPTVSARLRTARGMIQMRYLLAASFLTVVAAGAIVYAVPSQAGPSYPNSTTTTTPTTSTTSYAPPPPPHMGY